MSYILGLSSNGTDSSACLLGPQGLLLAVEEERFTRKKNDGRFPRNSVLWCLKESGIDPSDVKRIAVSWDYPRYWHRQDRPSSISDFYQSLERDGYAIYWPAVNRHIDRFQLSNILSKLRLAWPKATLPDLSFYPHHRCHAASSYCFSGFEQCLVLVSDEKGEDRCTSLHFVDGGRMRTIAECLVPHSLGLYYAGAAQHLGFVPFRDEGTLMALATRGSRNSDLYRWLLDNVIHKSTQVNPEYISKESFAYPRAHECFYTKQMMRGLLESGFPPRPPNGVIEPAHEDFAFTIQEILELIVREFLLKHAAQNKTDRLCMAGGVGLNCSLNGKLAQSALFTAMFVPPWTHDAGAAIGAAALALNEGELRLPQFGRLQRADWGPRYENADVERVLTQRGLRIAKSGDVTAEVAQRLAQGQIVGWFQGRAEFGPRALGQRSLLSHPSFPNNRQRLLSIKRRLPFRPFSPSILAEYAADYVVVEAANASFMTTALQATSRAHRDIPDTINQPDGTVRVQVVEKRPGWRYRQLLEHFYDRSGLPALLNTSFNVEEPMVSTPEHAVNTFVRANINVLAIEDFVVTQPALGSF